MTIKIKQSEDGGTATCWVGDDESDSFVVSGRPDSVAAVMRMLRSAASEHEFSQRGVNFPPVANDLTKAEADAAAEAKANADRAAAAATEAEKLAATHASIKAEIERLSALIPS